MILIGDLDVPNGRGARGTLCVFAAVQDGDAERAQRVRELYATPASETGAWSIVSACGDYIGGACRVEIVRPWSPGAIGMARLLA